MPKSLNIEHVGAVYDCPNQVRIMIAEISESANVGAVYDCPNQVRIMIAEMESERGAKSESANVHVGAV